MFKAKFNVELRNRFSELMVEKNTNEDCIQMEKTFTQKLPKTCEREEQWLREETWKAIEKRKMIHDKIHSLHDRRKCN